MTSEGSDSQFRGRPHISPAYAKHRFTLPHPQSERRIALYRAATIANRYFTIHVELMYKNGTPGIHGLQGDELRLLRALRREHPHADFVFLSERNSPLSVAGVQKLIERLGESARLPFRSTLTCCGMPLDTPWRLVESIQGLCRPSWAIAPLRTPLCRRGR